MCLSVTGGGGIQQKQTEAAVTLATVSVRSWNWAVL